MKNTAQTRKAVNVLIVEDSLVARELLVYIFNSDPEITVLSAVGDGEKAIDFVRKYRPDVITMDVHMPGIDGFETTRKIMEIQPVPIVIVSSAVTPGSAEASFRAMEAGALCLAEKPPGIGDPFYPAKAGELVKTVKLMSEVKVVRRRSEFCRKKAVFPATPMPENRNLKKIPDIKIVAVGVSTGGPPVIQTILGLLPKNFPVPILIVQHIASGFLEGMAIWLEQKTGFPVHIPANGDRLMPGHVYLAPDNVHMGISRMQTVILTQNGSEKGICPSVSCLFQSVNEVFGSNAAGVLLTGMGEDGAKELLMMRENHAVTMVQDRESCAVSGMPDAAVKLGAAMYVLSPEKIAEKLTELTGLKPAGTDAESVHAASGREGL